jgi:hypothetical protein
MTKEELAKLLEKSAADSAEGKSEDDADDADDADDVALRGDAGLVAPRPFRHCCSCAPSEVQGSA